MSLRMGGQVVKEIQIYSRDHKCDIFSVSKATLQSQMSDRLFVRPSPKPLNSLKSSSFVILHSSFIILKYTQHDNDCIPRQNSIEYVHQQQYLCLLYEVFNLCQYFQNHLDLDQTSAEQIQFRIRRLAEFIISNVFQC